MLCCQIIVMWLNLLILFRKINFLKLFTCLLLILSVYFLSLYIKWGVVEAFKYYPSWDESVILTLIGNFARFGEYETQFGFYNSPKNFDPFMSIGPPYIFILSFFTKVFGYHFYIIGLIVFFLVSVPLIIFSIILINSFFTNKFTRLNKIIINLLFLLFLVTNRLFYASPPTGGSFTHGPLGEPFSLMSILLACIFLLYGIKKKKIILVFIAGVFSSLAYETKTLSIIYFISQLFVIMFFTLLIYFKSSNKKVKIFFKKVIGVFVLGFTTLTGFIWIWVRLHFNTLEYIQFSCWKKIAFTTNGSGIQNLKNISLHQFVHNFRNAFNVIIDFFSKDIGKPWGIQDKNIITLFFVLFYYLLFKRLFNKSKLLLNTRKNISYEFLSRDIIELGLMLTFLLGSLWYFFISDFQWIRHYYIFIFIGFTIFPIIFFESVNKRLINIFSISLCIYIFVSFFLKSPLNTSYHFSEIGNFNTEKVDQEFINFIKTHTDDKVYVCGIFKAQTASFLSGINFNNNLLESDREVYQKCDFLPGRKIKKDLNPPFLYINNASEAFYPECINYFNENINKFKKIYNYGNGVYEML